MIIGILFLIVGNRNPQAISITIGIYVFLDGLLKLQTALDARKFGVPKWFIMLLTAVLVVLVGIVALLAPYLDEIPQFVLLAVSLIVDGLVNIWITAYTVRIRAKKKNLEERFGLSEDEKDHKPE